MPRLACLWLLCVLAAAFCASTEVALAQKQPLGEESFIYVGTRTGEASEAKGIYLFKLRTSDDPDIPEFVTVKPLGLVAECDSPSYLEIDAKGGRLFCVNEVDSFEGQKSGAVSAYAIEPTSGQLTLLNRRSSGGAGPCHLALDKSGKFLVVANDAGGSVAVLPVATDGQLGEASDGQRQAGHDAKQTSHPRGVTFSPDGKYLFVCDAGLDKIFAYQFDAQTGKLTLASSVPAKAGAGPRRLIFRPDGKFAYAINELDSTVTAFAYDPQAGTLKELQTLSTLPGYFDGANTTAEIGVHPSGKNLLVSNCGHHSVVLFTIDDKSGELTYVEDQSTYGTNPRHFGIAGDGKHVVVANQDSGSILILRAPENARVKPGGNATKTPSPTCAKFLPN